MSDPITAETPTDTIRDHLTAKLAAADPHHPANEPPHPWHSIAMGAVFDLAIKLSDPVARPVLQHIRDGGR